LHNKAKMVRKYWGKKRIEHKSCINILQFSNIQWNFLNKQYQNVQKSCKYPKITMNDKKEQDR